VAFSDPQSVTIGAATISLARVSSGDNTGIFSKDDQNVKLSASHQYGKRVRRTIRLDHRKVAADPLIAAQNLNYNMACYIVVDVPTLGYSPSEVKEVLDGLLANLQASSGANTVKFLGGQS